jgi:outer membrane protein assembly factor BamB
MVWTRLWAVSPGNGKKLAEYRLDSLPVWDGMIAANGNIYLASMNGEVICYSEKGN